MVDTRIATAAAALARDPKHSGAAIEGLGILGLKSQRTIRLGGEALTETAPRPGLP
jgi:hypothetical protein